MAKKQRILLSLIILFTILAILINMPRRIPISFESPVLPVINKKISIHSELKGFNPNFFLGPFHISRDFSFRKGLDLEGGTSITLKADMKDVAKERRNEALEATKTVIERRINFLGVSEPTIQTAKVNNDYRIIVEIPGVSDVDQAVALIGTTAKLEFRELLEEPSPSSLITLENTKSIGLSGADLGSAQASFDQNTGQPVVLFTISDESQKKFFDTTQKLKGKRMAIFLDNQFISAPVVQEAIRSNGQISGGFTTEQAKQLATLLNAGALPAPLSILEQRSVGATLGAESLQKSLFAGLLGFFIIVVFMVVLYGRLGVLASVALLLYTLYVLAIFKVIPVTLTLAGIAGFVLSIGMAVDANILIFARMKEELRMGKPWPVAVELGFSRAWSSIRDSNVSSILTSIILIYFGTGIVRGFAVTLLIGVLVSMFSAIIVTRTFLRMAYK